MYIVTLYFFAFTSIYLAHQHLCLYERTLYLYPEILCFMGLKNRSDLERLVLRAGSTPKEIK